MASHFIISYFNFRIIYISCPFLKVTIKFHHYNNHFTNTFFKFIKICLFPSSLLLQLSDSFLLQLQTCFCSHSWRWKTLLSKKTFERARGTATPQYPEISPLLPFLSLFFFLSLSLKHSHTHSSSPHLLSVWCKRAYWMLLIWIRVFSSVWLTAEARKCIQTFLPLCISLSLQSHTNTFSTWPFQFQSAHKKFRER